LILACAVTPANRPEEEAAPLLRDDIKRLPGRRRTIDQLYVDRGYIGSVLVRDVLDRRGEIICKPWVARNGKLFAKKDFVLNMRDRTIRCPAGEVETLGTDPDARTPRPGCGRMSSEGYGGPRTNSGASGPSNALLVACRFQRGGSRHRRLDRGPRVAATDRSRASGGFAANRGRGAGTRQSATLRVHPVKRTANWRFSAVAFT
jgi:hypothetical protein